MTTRAKLDRRTTGLAVASLILVTAVGVSLMPTSSATARASSSPTFRSPVTAGKMHRASEAQARAQVAALDKTTGFHCQQPSNPVHCYGPSQIRNAYAIQPLLDKGQDGSGRTITIIDAFQNPTMASDLASFDSQFGLPTPDFKTIAPLGLTPFDTTDPNQIGWSGEIALDVEWAHAVAPGAKIVLALAPSDADSDLVAVENYVINKGIGDVVSMSFGEAEQCMDPQLQLQEHALFAKATASGMTLVAGSGDEGAAQYTCDFSDVLKAVSIPASDPNVTSVGGTDLQANLKSGKYQNESVWNDPNGGAGGGGFSSLYSRPSFQNGIAGIGSMRGLPDVTYTASYTDAVLVAWGSSQSPGSIYWYFGGTSVGAPQWAGIVAIADQTARKDLGNINGALYKISRNSDDNSGAFRDVTAGNNDFSPVSGYNAHPGWDAASGLGSPVANKLVAALADR